jgi:hypothetical protein
MQTSIRVYLEELAELREKAELLCGETKDIIDEYRRLKAGLRDHRPETPPISIVSADLTASYAVPPRSVPPVHPPGLGRPRRSSRP